MTAESLPIRPDEPEATQSMTALLKARDEGLIANRWPVDMSDPAQVETLYRDLFHVDMDDPAQVDAMAQEIAQGNRLPTDGGMYYYFYVIDKDDRVRPMLIPEGHVKACIIGIGAVAGIPEEFEYRHGILPRR